MAPQRSRAGLSRRERQIMEAIYAHGPSTVTDVRRTIESPPGYSSVRTLMRILEQKGHLRHRKDGARYVYSAIRPRREAARSALRRLLDTFFDGSPERAVATLLDVADKRLGDDELNRLAEMIAEARSRGGGK